MGWCIVSDNNDKEKNSGKETFAYTGGNREKQSNLNLKPLNEKNNHRYRRIFLYWKKHHR